MDTPLDRDLLDKQRQNLAGGAQGNTQGWDVLWADMPAKHSRHIALTGPLAEWAERQVAKGEYTSVSDLIRTAIRLLKIQDEERQGIRSHTPDQNINGVK